VSEGGSLTFTEHLEELRGRIIICLVTLVVTTAISLPFADDLLVFLARPLQGVAAQPPPQAIHLVVRDGAVVRADVPPALRGHVIDPGQVPLIFEIHPASGEAYSVTYGRRTSSNLYYFGLTDPIYLIFKMALLMGLVLAMPFVGWQVWLFVAPGLTDRERAVAKPLIAVFVISFPIGAAFAYWLLQFAVVVLMGFSFGGLVLLPDVSRYLSFILTMMIAFGFVFETPGIFWVLGRLGVVSARWLAKQRKYAFVAAFIIAAVLTPTPDIFNQLSMALPLILLYEVSIWLVRWTERQAHETRGET
jgi:sec-independent protein translocase protein TatC